MADINLKQGDRLPALYAVLTDANGTPVDLTGGTVIVKFKLIGGGTGTEKGGTCTIVDAANGQVSYAWGATDTATPGDYNLEFVATLGGKQMTFPNEGYASMRIWDDLDSTD